MDVVIAPEAQIGEIVADDIAALIAARPDAVLGLATGSSPLRIYDACLLYTSPSPRDRQKSRMPSSA